MITHCILTLKQKNIITTALQLFANEGYNAVSTSKIAKEAHVSEGLIFRHFTNKKGLLEAIMHQAEEKLNELLTDIMLATDAKDIIRKSIILPFKVKKNDYPFWQLQFKLKWETAYHNPNKLKPWINKLTWAFTTLKYPEANMEAIKLSQIIESVSIQLIRNELKNKNVYKKHLLKSYKL